MCVCVCVSKAGPSSMADTVLAILVFSGGL